MTATAKPTAKPTATLTAALKAVGAADSKRGKALIVAAREIVAAYPTRAAWDAMPKETLQSLKAAFAAGRLTAEEFKLWSKPVKGLSDTVKADRLTLHKIVNTPWNRIVGHAYPKAEGDKAEGDKAEGDKAEGDKAEGDKADPKADTWAKVLSAMIDQAQKAEGIKGVDIAGFTSALRTARSFIVLTDAK